MRSGWIESGVVALSVLVPCVGAGPEAEVDRARLLQHMRDLPEFRALWAPPERQQGLIEAERIIEDSLRRIGYEPVSQTLEWKTPGSVPVVETGPDGEPRWSSVPDAEPRTWRNLYVDIPGRESPQEVILVGAHFDAQPTTPGADDNASGVAGVLELARVLKDRPMKRTVRLVFFNLEEIGLIGAREHALWMKSRIDAGQESLVGMVSVEMIGYFSDEPGSQKAPPLPPIPGLPELPTVGNTIALVGVLPSRDWVRTMDEAMRESEPGIPTFVFDFVPGNGALLPDIRRSDHAVFWDLGLPALMLTDTSEFRNPHYHKPTDTIETLDLDRMTLVVRALAGAVWRIAGPMPEPGDAPPAP